MIRYIGKHIFDYDAIFRQNVGIGTDTPSAALHVYGTTGIISESPSNAGITIRRNDNVQYSSLLKYHSGNTEKWVAGLSDAGDFTNSTGNEYFIGTAKTSPVFLINSSSNIGIGTASPSEKLDVSGNIKLTGDIDMNNGSITNSSNVLGFVAGSAKEALISAARDVRIVIDNNNDDTTNQFEIHKHSVSDSNQLLTLDQSGNLTVAGDLTVSGTTTTINTTNLNVEDKNITINYSTGDSSSTADGAGITIQDAVDSSNDATILWDATDDRFDFSHDIQLPDGAGVRLGTDADALVTHSGSNMSIVNNTGQVFFTQNTNDGDIIFNCDDGSGSTTEYMRIDGGAAITVVSREMRFADNVKLKLGNGPDSEFYHDGSNTYIANDTGNLIIQNNTDDGDVILKSDDGSGGVTSYFVLDGSVGFNRFYKHARFEDNVQARFGTGNDLQIYHTGTGSVIQNATGNLTIQQDHNDSDIIFRSDDGSGSTTEYFKIDGGTEKVVYSKPIEILDNNYLFFGNSQDLGMHHNGTDTTIKNNTGDFYIKQDAADKDIIFQSDDGSGGLATYFMLDGSIARNVFSKDVDFGDDISARFNGDLRLRSTGGNQYITSQGSNDLYIQQTTDDKDIIFQSDDGSGGLKSYFYLDGSIGATIVPDSTSLGFGTGGDMYISHDATNTHITNFTGHLYITNKSDDKDIILRSDDGSGGITEYITLDGSAETVELAKPTNVASTLKVTGGAVTGGNSVQLVYNANYAQIQLKGSTGGFVNFSDSTTDFKGRILYLNSDNSMRFSTNASEAMRITSGGSLLVGVTSGSTAKLQSISPDGNSSSLRIGRADNSNFWEFNHAGNDLRIYNQSSSGSHILLGVDPSGNAEANSVGIGIATPAYKLDVRNSGNLFYGQTDLSNTTSIFRLRADAGSTEVLDIHADGKVGIGTTSPEFPLDVKGAVNALQLTNSDYSSGSAGSRIRFTFGSSTGNTFAKIQTTDAGGVSASNLILQSDSGNVGIGTDSPVHKLVVLGGNIQTDGIVYSNTIRDNTGGDVNIQDNGGNVGIGNNAPASTLHVSGTVQVGVDDTGHDVIFYGATSGMYLQWDESDNSLKLRDNVKLKIGSSNDLAIHHSGTNSEIKNQTGNLIIQNTSDDSDIIFKTDNGSGGTTTYMTIDGSDTSVLFSETLKVADSKYIGLGNSFDFHLQHNGTDSKITNSTGDLYIVNGADDKDVIFQSDDGSGGVTTYLTLDGSDTKVLFSKSAKYNDNVKSLYGAGLDLQIYHDGSNSYISQNGTGHLYIENNNDDQDIIFRCDDGSGGVATYLQVDGGSTRTRAFKDINFDDNIKATYGADSDLKIYHDGTDSQIKNATGDLKIEVGADDKDIIFRGDDQSGGVTTYFRLDGSTGYVQFADNRRITIGSGDDANIRHDGTDTYIGNSTGHFYIQQAADDKDLVFQCDDGSGGLATYITIDGSTNRVNFNKPIKMADNTAINVGSGIDFTIKHDSNNTLIENLTGHLYFYQKADDSDISFFCDDGSGGNTEYFRIDGGDEKIYAYKDVKFGDSINASFGNNDLLIQHNGTKSFINNYTGDLEISNLADDSDIKFICDNGSGGTATYITIDGSATNIAVSKDMVFADNIDAHFGAGSDMILHHNGTDNFIQSFNGDLKLIQYADDKDIIFQCDDQSGGVTTYLTIDGSNGYIRLEDDRRLTIGSGNDLQLRHTSSGTFITNFTHDFNIVQQAADKDITFQCDDGSGGVAEYFRLDGDVGYMIASKAIRALDSVNLQLGASADFTMQHNGTNTILQNFTGDLEIIQGADDSDIIFKSDDGSGGTTAYFTLDGGLGRTNIHKRVRVDDNIQFQLGSDADIQFSHTGSIGYLYNNTGDFRFRQNADDKDIIFQCDDGSGGTTEYLRIDGDTVTVEVSKPINLASASSSASSGIYAQFINLKGFCTLAANYKFAEDLEDTLAPFEMALDYGSDTISSSTEVNQSQLFRASGFHVPVACSVNAINMQLTCNNAGNVTIAVVEYRPSEAGTDQVDHPRTVYEEVVVASNDNNNKVKTVTVATADLDNTAIPAGSHIMIMAKGDDQSTGGKAFISAAIEIKW